MSELKQKQTTTTSSADVYICPECGCPMILDEGLLICPECGLSISLDQFDFGGEQN